MPHVTQSQIDSANHVDLAQFLISRGEKLKRVSGEYIWESQNVWIRENKWFSHYEQKGGYPVEFVMKFFGLTFTDAVCELIGEHKSGYCADNPEKSANDYSGSHLLPKSNKNTYRIYLYLKNKRGIAPEIINAFAKMGLIYEDKEHHSCVFVGRNENNRPGHCHVRSTITNFRQTIKGSKAEYAFHYNGTGDTIFAFEAPIDMLAYISMHMERWRENSYVALCSVSEKALIDLLNTLNDENEELKKEVKQLKNKIKTYNSTHELLKETIDRLRSDG